ncbi:winged helix-turn-helix transcriptional regulator [Nitrosopumilus ureiphilus]|uniref:Transcriptional regulator n=1 Tax=Nitrosopumilus ureiphilus TaxID=1470067 RepID=A0A7D5R2F9_9ARCH|nr:helix-turn-helix domain-containing protein [Nitrosopumilus ureiphilus]QLH07456.1 transcriptional regulator [Nitrosopumilus ureiphilus]
MNERKRIDKNMENLFFRTDGIRKIICKKWSLEIINIIDKRKQLRYKDIASMFEGISPTALSSVLKELEMEKIIKKEKFNEIPPRTEYSLLQRGEDLLHAITPLKKWIMVDKRTT